jgi:succinyl-diaminopimelate desuccinylase
MDVVPVGSGWTTDAYGGTVVGDRFFGRGSADMKGGLAAMVLAATIVQRLGFRLRGDLLVTAVVDEEVSSKGIKHYMETRRAGDFAIVGEPTELALCTAQKGQITYELTALGRSAHSSIPSEGINAISKMFKIIKEIEEYSSTLTEKKHRLLGSPTTNVGTISGGTSACSVPPSCTITVDRRTLPGETLQSIDAEFHAIVERQSRNDKEFRATVKRFFALGPMETSDDELIVRALRQTCKELLSFDPGIHGFVATCDAGQLCTRVPTVIFGPGSLSQAHRPDEYVSIKQVLDAAFVYAGTAIVLLK